MKSILLFALVGLFSGLMTTASAQDIKDQLASEACECIGKKDVDNMDAEDLQMQLSLCLMEAVGNNQAAFEKEYGTLDPSNQEALQQMGQDIGMRMVTKCPQYMMKLASQAPGQQQMAPAPSKVQAKLAGTIKSVEGDEVGVVTIAEASGRTHRLLWLDFFSGSDKLQDTKQAVGKKVTVQYEEIEAYSPKAQEYIKRKKLTGVSFQ
jgi:hypothetical protein